MSRMVPRVVLVWLVMVVAIAAGYSQPKTGERIRVMRDSVFHDVALPSIPQSYLDDPTMIANYLPLIRVQIHDESIIRLVTMNGKPVELMREVLEQKDVIALGKDQLFFWPYVAKDHVHNLDGMELDRKSQMRVISRSDQPRVLEVENLLSDEEADLIVSLAAPIMKRSNVVLKKGETAERYHEVRTSSNVFLENRRHPTLVTIARRVANLTRTELRQAEDMQVIHYSPMQHYHAHYDYIDHEAYPVYEGRHPYDNRYVTVLFYLSNVTRGGHTVFPKAHPYYDANLLGYAEKVCADRFETLKVYPKKGNAIIFYNMDEANQHLGVKDDYSLHGGCDVVEGEKWAANYWIHNYYWSVGAPPKPWPTHFAPKLPVPARRIVQTFPRPYVASEESLNTAERPEGEPVAQVEQNEHSVKIRMPDADAKKEEEEATLAENDDGNTRDEL